MKEYPKQPRQPSNLEIEDRDDLAVLGHRIEIWNEARTGGQPLPERIETLEQELVGEIERVPGNASGAERLLLEEELRDVLDYAGTEAEFNEYCLEKENYYTEVRAQTINLINDPDATLPEA